MAHAESSATSPNSVPPPAVTTATDAFLPLASLLSEADVEITSLRRDLADAQKRADRAERVAAPLQALYDFFSATAAEGGRQSTVPVSKPPNATCHPPKPAPDATDGSGDAADAGDDNTPSQPPPPPSLTTPDMLNHPALQGPVLKLLLNALVRADTAKAQADAASARVHTVGDMWIAFLRRLEAHIADVRAGFMRLGREEGGVLMFPVGDGGLGVGSVGGNGLEHRCEGRTRGSDHGWKTQAIALPSLLPHPALAHVHSHEHGSHSNLNNANTPTSTHPHTHQRAPQLITNHTLSHANTYPTPTNRRQRTPSLDAYSAVPPKKARSNYDREREGRECDLGPQLTEPHRHPQGKHSNQGQAQVQEYLHSQQHGYGRVSSRQSQSQSQVQVQLQGQAWTIPPLRHYGEGYKQQQPFVGPGVEEQAGRGRSCCRAHSGSHSSTLLPSVDEMLLHAMTGGEGPGRNADAGPVSSVAGVAPTPGGSAPVTRNVMGRGPHGEKRAERGGGWDREWEGESVYETNSIGPGSGSGRLKEED